MIYDLVQVAYELTWHPLFAGLKLGGATLPSRWRGHGWEGCVGCWGDAVSSEGVWSSFPAALALP